MNNRHYGSRGEQVASDFLIEKGYTVLCRNFRVGRMGELDIIAKDRDILCFVEVKTRSNTLYGRPGEAVTYTKQTTIRRIAQIYMQRFHLEDSPVRFDVAELMMDREGQVKDINLIQNAF